MESVASISELSRATRSPSSGEIGTTDKGRKELVTLEGGFRESEISWTEVLVDLKRRGPKIAPELAVGDGALEVLEGVVQGVRHHRAAGFIRPPMS